MLKAFALGATMSVASGVGAPALLTARIYRRLPTPSHVAMNGITSIPYAVAACRRSGLTGWEPVAHKVTYSRLTTWDAPAVAFESGRGYCEQQALALKAIYDALGIQARPVFAVRCAFPAKMVDGVRWPGGMSGHTWLRMRIGGEERDVCPGSVENTPGRTQFQVLSPVRAWSPWLRPFTHLGSSLENMRRDMVAQRVGAAPSPAIQAGGQQ